MLRADKYQKYKHNEKEQEKEKKLGITCVAYYLSYILITYAHTRTIRYTCI